MLLVLLVVLLLQIKSFRLGILSILLLVLLVVGRSTTTPDKGFENGETVNNNTRS